MLENGDQLICKRGSNTVSTLLTTLILKLKEA